jgi:hypothetical protein
LFREKEGKVFEFEKGEEVEDRCVALYAVE